jgi:hypothetical protein
MAYRHGSRVRSPVMRILRLLLLSISIPAFAQTNEPYRLNLLSPSDYQVFQRQTTGGGNVVIDVLLETTNRGTLANLEKLEARLMGVSGDRKDLAEWQPLPFDRRVRHFRTALEVPAGGWYRLDVRLAGAGTNIATAGVEHFGVGEIFVIGGQSNSANHGEEKQTPKSPLVVAWATNHWQPAGDPEPGASGKGGSFMPAFGDAMAEKYKVPIGLVAIGEGSTSVREWLPRNDAMAAPPDTGRHTIFAGTNLWLSNGELFDRIIAAQHLLGTNGFRALLWHQGESDCQEPPDRQITPEQYRQYLQRVIEASRASAGWRVPWFVAQASYHPGGTGSPELRAAQKSLVTDGLALVGPNTDELGPEFRQDNGKGIHFNARGEQRHGQLWAAMVGAWLDGQWSAPAR